MSPGALVRILQAALAAAQMEAARSSEEQGATPTIDADRLVGPGDVGVSRTTWRTAIRRGQLEAIRVGRELRARKSAVDVWLATLETRPPKSARRAVSETEDTADPMSKALARAAERRRRTR